MTGTVKFFNESKGFGFITNDETKKKEEKERSLDKFK